MYLPDVHPPWVKTVKTLKDWLPPDFYPVWDVADWKRTEKKVDCPLVAFVINSVDINWLGHPFKQKWIADWCLIKDVESKWFYAVGWNTNPSIGYNFPIKRLSRSKMLDWILYMKDQDQQQARDIPENVVINRGFVKPHHVYFHQLKQTFDKEKSHNANLI